MRVIFGLVLVLGVALAGFAVYMVRGYVNSYQTALAEERANQPTVVPTVEVYVAKEQMKYGQVITAENVRAVAWPKSAMPEGTFIVGENELFTPTLDRRFVLRAMEKDEPVLAVKVTKEGQDGSLESRLGRGMRAVTIKVDEESGVSGFIRPGAKVDIFFTGRIEIDGSRRDVSRVIQQGIEVIAVDQSSSTEITEATLARTVTVAATSEQAQTLALAQQKGNLTLALVGIDDDTSFETAAIDERALLGFEPEVVQEEIKQEATQQTCFRTERRGVEVTQVPKPCPQN